MAMNEQVRAGLKTEFFDTPEGRLAYTDYGGNGELVLMLPGLGALRTEYRYLAPRLREAGYHSVAADLRGHGESRFHGNATTYPR
jgi:alpha-beta hydrolase superfamily lysophospholipase